MDDVKRAVTTGVLAMVLQYRLQCSSETVFSLIISKNCALMLTESSIMLKDTLKYFVQLVPTLDIFPYCTCSATSL